MPPCLVNGIDQEIRVRIIFRAFIAQLVSADSFEYVEILPLGSGIMMFSVQGMA